jgi:hypothetical protein
VAFDPLSHRPYTTAWDITSARITDECMKSFHNCSVQARTDAREMQSRLHSSRFQSHAPCTQTRTTRPPHLPLPEFGLTVVRAFLLRERPLPWIATICQTRVTMPAAACELQHINGPSDRSRQTVRLSLVSLDGHASKGRLAPRRTCRGASNVCTRGSMPPSLVNNTKLIHHLRARSAQIHPPLPAGSQDHNIGMGMRLQHVCPLVHYCWHARQEDGVTLADLPRVTFPRPKAEDQTSH